MNKGLLAGIAGGLIWGVMSLGITIILGISAREGSLTNNIITFLTGGAILGAVTGGIFSVTEEKLPFRNPILQGMTISTGVWALLLGGALALSLTSPTRYQINIKEIASGFILVSALGGIVGWVRKKMA